MTGQFVSFVAPDKSSWQAQLAATRELLQSVSQPPLGTSACAIRRN